MLPGLPAWQASGLAACMPTGCVAQVTIPLWALVHLPVVITLSTAAFTPTARPPRPALRLGCGCACPALTYRLGVGYMVRVCNNT